MTCYYYCSAEVRPLREKMQNFSVDYNDKKSGYDSVAAGLESNMAKLEQDVKVIFLILDTQLVNASSFSFVNLYIKIFIRLNKEKMSEIKDFNKI